MTHAPVSLNGADLERLLFTIDTSIKVNKRFQFFLWAQGPLQSFLPHETLVCLLGDLQGLRMRNEVFSRAIVDPDFERGLSDPLNGFVPELLAAWQANGHAPLSYDAHSLPHPALARWAPGHVIAHGAREAGGEFDSFFIFLRTPSAVGARERYLIELLMPQLHMAVQRVCLSERDTPGGAIDRSLLSEREVQVLRWIRDGKTNHEIGQILSISPLTVKNHVQKILRKLNVANRAQAVARAATSGVFVGHGERLRS